MELLQKWRELTGNNLRHTCKHCGCVNHKHLAASITYNTICESQVPDDPESEIYNFAESVAIHYLPDSRKCTFDEQKLSKGIDEWAHRTRMNGTRDYVWGYRGFENNYDAAIGRSRPMTMVPYAGLQYNCLYSFDNQTEENCSIESDRWLML